MGIFDRLKQARNFISGGSASVSLSFDKAYYIQGETINVTVHCQVKERDIFINKVYLNIRATETVKVKVRNTSTHRTGTNVHNPTSQRTETETYVSFKMDQQIAEAQALQANQKYEWKASIELPNDVIPTYLGQNATHLWKVYAGLDTSGNDPDSGWQEFTLFGNMRPSSA